MEIFFDLFAHLPSMIFLDSILTHRHQPESSHRRTLGILEFPSIYFPFPVTSTIIDPLVMDFTFCLNNAATIPPPQEQSSTLGIMSSGLVVMNPTLVNSVNISSIPSLYLLGWFIRPGFHLVIYLVLP